MQSALEMRRAQIAATAAEDAAEKIVRMADVDAEREAAAEAITRERKARSKIEEYAACVSGELRREKGSETAAPGEIEKLINIAVSVWTKIHQTQNKAVVHARRSNGGGDSSSSSSSSNGDRAAKTIKRQSYVDHIDEIKTAIRRYMLSAWAAPEAVLHEARASLAPAIDSGRQRAQNQGVSKQYSDFIMAKFSTSLTEDPRFRWIAYSNEIIAVSLARVFKAYGGAPCVWSGAITAARFIAKKAFNDADWEPRNVSLVVARTVHALSAVEYFISSKTPDAVERYSAAMSLEPRHFSSTLVDACLAHREQLAPGVRAVDVFTQSFDECSWFLSQKCQSGKKVDLFDKPCESHQSVVDALAKYTLSNERMIIGAITSARLTAQ